MTVIEDFTEAVQAVHEVYHQHRPARPAAPFDMGPYYYLFSEEYLQMAREVNPILVEAPVRLKFDPDDPTKAARIVDNYDRDLLNLIEEYRKLVKDALKEHFKEEVVKKPVVDVKPFSKSLIKASDEINGKGVKVIAKRTKEGYFQGVKFAGRTLQPYKINVAFDLPYDDTIIEALQTRSTGDFKGLLDDQGKEINRIVVDGALRGQTVRQIATRIDGAVDSIGRVRASTIARTELMQSVNTGIRSRYATSGISLLKRVETRDARTCTDWPFNNAIIAGRTWRGCVSIAGKVFTLADAALLDANTHPNERGSWEPYIPGVSAPAEMAG